MRVPRLLLIVWLTLQGVLLFAADPSFSGRVLDPQGNPVQGAPVQLEAGGRIFQVVTDASGSFEFSHVAATEGTVRVAVSGFAPQSLAAQSGQLLDVHLLTATVTENVSVTASRTAIPTTASPASIRVVPEAQLQQAASPVLDDKLRNVPGVQLFRRSSSLVANPTSQGISLRGLGSTAASRTLVLADGIPINDAFGGWIHWNEVPELSIQEVEILRGGGSDLYGSSAIGGVINLLEQPAGFTAYEVDLSDGSENTRKGSLLGTSARGPWSGSFAGDWLRTDGYILVAPQSRGTIDLPSNVHYQNAELDLRRTLSTHGSGFLRGGLLNEARNNGTPNQTNATRLWRYVSGLDWTATHAGTFSLRLFGSDQHYRQSFSTTNATRTTDRLNRLQTVPDSELGGSAQFTRSLGTRVTLLGGSDVHDVRGTDFEIPITSGVGTGFTDTSARQRQVGVFGEALLQWRRLTITASLRGDHFSNLDARQFTQTRGVLTQTAIPDRSETVANPKLGAVRQITSTFALTASGYRAFRSPSLNELYRTSQVGQTITTANPNLLSERATGWEAGVQLTQPSRTSVVRASYFWIEVNRPVTALTVSTTATQILNQRANLGQIRSRGLSLDFEATPLPWLQIAGGYQYAEATVTRFDQQPSLIGKWIPQVPHNMATTQLTLSKRRIGTLSLQGRLSGRQFDDDQNTFLLHGYFRMDAYASRAFGSYVDVFASGENLFDRAIEVGRTPILTLGTPRIARAGLRIHSKR